MLSYLPPLLRASEILLKGLSEDPSAWGVSAAFMACEDEMEDAMVAWSGIAGQFFVNKRRKLKSWRGGSIDLRSREASPPVPPLPSSVLSASLASTGGEMA